MIALHCDWLGDGQRLDDRLARSLDLGNGSAAFFRHGNHALAASIRTSGRGLRHWVPAQGPDNSRVLFNGQFDNAVEIAGKLGLPSAKADPAVIYAQAVARWGDSADLHCIGHYASIVISADGLAARLSRSPISAPPLHYTIDASGCIAASVPRVLLAMGVAPRIEQQRIEANLLFDECSPDTGWYEGTWQVSRGTVVHLSPGGRRVVDYYDAASIPVVPCSLADAAVEAQRLLEEAAGKAIAGYARPGVLLSGGFDSPLAALAVLEAIPAGQQLPGFTFVPCADWAEVDHPLYYGDERPLVEQFAAMHPRIRPHFFTNEDVYFDHRLNDLFLAMGCAPAPLPTFHTFHALWQGARDEGCDIVISADLGNFTYSERAWWAPAEYLRRLRLGQMKRAVDEATGAGLRPGNLLRHAVLPHLPVRSRLALRRAAQRKAYRDYAQTSTAAHPDLAQRRRDAIVAHPRYASFEGLIPRDRNQALANWLSPYDGGYGDIRQGFSQLYGIAHRDISAYRPLVEFCLSLPTECFNSDGESRRLARTMAAGRLPEAILNKRQSGLWGADWQQKLGRRRAELLAEVQSLRQQDNLRTLIDFDKIEAALTDWPSGTTYDHEPLRMRLVGITQAIVNARFINYVEGRNLG